MNYHSEDLINEVLDELERISSPHNIEFKNDLLQYLPKLKINSLVIIKEALRKINKHKELEEQAQFLDDIIENIPNMIFIKEAENLTFVKFNKAGEDLIGHDRSSLIGRNDYDFFKKEEADFFTSIDRKVLSQKEALDIPQELIKTEHLGQRTLHTKKIPLLDEQGNAKFLLGISEDITDMLQIEEANKDLQKQLFQSQKLESLGKLVGGIAHEFNNLLGGILPYASMLAKQYQDEPETAKKLNSIVTTSLRAKKLTQDLLGFARQGNYKQENININESVEEALSLLDASLPKSISIQTQLEPDLKMIHADGTQILQCLLNLCLNSKDAIGNHEGSIIISTKNFLHQTQENSPPFKKRLPPGPYVLLSIEDNGHGIPESIQDKIFDPFFTNKELGQGTGLGLSMVYGIVENQKGSIDFESKENCGCRFDLYFPALKHGEKLTHHEKPSITDLASQKEKNQKLQNKEILIVDDEEFIRNVLFDILKETGAQITLANDGLHALDVLENKNYNFDLIILDTMMPKLDGIRMYQMIKERLKSSSVLFSSGYAESEMIAKLQQNHNVSFIMKPFTENQILKKIEELIA